MGTTLTGTTPQDTYDSLIKVTDNGPLSGTAKYLSDGLGNDSALAVSTARVGVGTATPSQKLSVSGGNLLVNNGTSPDSNSGIRIVAPISTTHYNWMIAAQQNISGGFELTPSSAVGGTTFSTPALSILGASGNVGIGTSAPSSALEVKGANATLRLTPAAQNQSQAIELGVLNSSVNAYAKIDVTNTVTYDTNIRFFTNASGSTTQVERLRILSTGGITFNGDTAAANALDDYEEGTWTMGITFGGASVGVTYTTNTGTYTKIGRQVTVNGLVVLSNKGSSSGTASITGLPFTVPNNTANYAAANVWLANMSFANQFQAINIINSTRIDFYEITEAGTLTALDDSNFANNSEVIVSLTYFV